MLLLDPVLKPKERPALFQPSMVRGLLREVDPKLQTRRVMERQKKYDFTDYTLFGQAGSHATASGRRSSTPRTGPTARRISARAPMQATAATGCGCVRRGARTSGTTRWRRATSRPTPP
jgi:hypothetical protein